ncbi:MAG: 30S ribosomal protein S17 [Patescibacteria group bacterium]|jgi:small subunit ribosomal protein S17
MSKRIFEGTVVSDKMEKTVVVAVDIPKRHRIYNKTMRNTKRFKARDEMGAHEGDWVRIEECKPYSKETSWKVIEVKKEDK